MGSFFANCNYSIKEEVKSLPTNLPESIISQKIPKIKTDSTVSTLVKITEPVNIKNIKKMINIATTSGVLPTSESANFCRPTGNGFFGHYQLITKNNSKYPLIGQLIIFTTDKPQEWKFDNNNETFVEIKLVSSDIKVWESISIGSTEKEVLQFIGSNFHYKKENVLYCEIGIYSANFVIIKNKVTQLTVGKYCINK